MTPSCIGTLRSARSRTRLPATLAVSRVRKVIWVSRVRSFQPRGSALGAGWRQAPCWGDAGGRGLRLHGSTVARALFAWVARGRGGLAPCGSRGAAGAARMVGRGRERAPRIKKGRVLTLPFVAKRLAGAPFLPLPAAFPLSSVTAPWSSGRGRWSSSAIRTSRLACFSFRLSIWACRLMVPPCEVSARAGTACRKTVIPADP